MPEETVVQGGPSRTETTSEADAHPAWTPAPTCGEQPAAAAAPVLGRTEDSQADAAGFHDTSSRAGTHDTADQADPRAMDSRGDRAGSGDGDRRGGPAGPKGGRADADRTGSDAEEPEGDDDDFPGGGAVTAARKLLRGNRSRTLPRTFTPGVRAQLRVADAPSRNAEQLERVREALSHSVIRLQKRTSTLSDRALDAWLRRPRSWAECTELAERGRAGIQRQAPVARAWAIRHRVLIGGVAAVLIFASADSALALIPTDAAVEPGMALRIPVPYPLQIQTPPESSKRYLDAINNGENLREQAVVEAAAAATLERAKAEAAAAVAGKPQPWLTAPSTPDSVFPPGYVIPGAGGFVLPARGVFTSGFGSRWGTFHAGIDIAAPLGSPIYAVAAGTVIDAGPAQGFGLWVRIRHDDGTISVYGHMYDFSVSVGERVPAGLQIARIGNRGDSTGPHLHFEIIVDGRHVDPQAWLAQRGIMVG